MPFTGCLTGKIAFLYEDQDRARFQDSWFKSLHDKECSELKFRLLERISSVYGFYTEQKSP